MVKKKILICYDELGVRESLNLILEDSYDLDFSSCGKDAVEERLDQRGLKEVLPAITPELHAQRLFQGFP